LRAIIYNGDREALEGTPIEAEREELPTVFYPKGLLAAAE
jgi:hypothetical protein